MKYVGVIAIILLVFVFLSLNMEAMEYLKEQLEKNLNYGSFLALMAVLPVFGFPISAFLILGGIRFGIIWGLLAMAVTFPIHLLLTFLVTHSFLRSRVESFLKRHNYQMPKIPAHRTVIYTSLLVALPSFPYAVKNYLLALTGISLRLFFVLVLPIHLVVGAAFVILGKSVITFNLTLSLILIGVIVIGKLIINRLQSNHAYPDVAHRPPDLESMFKCSG